MARYSKQSKLRFGVIGCGYIAQSVHLPLLSRMPDVKVEALADIDDHQLKRAGLLHPSAQKFNDYHELLTIEEIDSLIISVPNALHAEVAKAAIEAGKAIYLETPLASNMVSAHEVLQLWRQSGLIGMIGYNPRFNPLYQQMRGMIEKDYAGGIVGARSVFTTFAQSPPECTAVQEDGGGVLLEKASHEIDLTRFLFNAEIERVFAERVSDSNADTVSMQLYLTNGISVQGLFSLGSVEESRYEVYCKNCKLSVDRYHSWKLNRRGLYAKGLMSKIGDLLSEIRAFPFGFKKLRSPENEPSHQIALKHFVDGVRYEKPVKPDIEDGFRVMQVISAAEESIKTGQPSVVESHNRRLFYETPHKSRCAVIIPNEGMTVPLRRKRLPRADWIQR